MRGTGLFDLHDVKFRGHRLFINFGRLVEHFVGYPRGDHRIHLRRGSFLIKVAQTVRRFGNETRPRRLLFPLRLTGKHILPGGASGQGAGCQDNKHFFHEFLAFLYETSRKRSIRNNYYFLNQIFAVRGIFDSFIAFIFFMLYIRRQIFNRQTRR